MISLPSNISINNLIDDLRIFSWEASDTLLYYSQILKDSNFKSNIVENNNYDDPVTKADLKVNEIIIERIQKKYIDVDWGILSEESIKLSNYSNISKDWLWVLDPLDGTKDFIQGTNNYAMHLALNYKNKSCIGIVLIPERDELWITDGTKVWCENKDGLEIVPEFSKNKILEEMVIVSSKNHRNETLQKLINKINFKEVITMGSIGCKIASILRGESDIYISLSLPGKSAPKDWDFAAPEAILKAAGGVITDINNKEICYGKSNFEQGGILIASNDRDKHADICLQIKEVINKYSIYPLNY